MRTKLDNTELLNKELEIFRRRTFAREIYSPNSKLL